VDPAPIQQIGLAGRRVHARLSPHLAGQELQRLLFPIWAHVKVWTARVAFRAHNLLGQRCYFDIVSNFRHIDNGFM
jgi:hypothetical protein